MCKKLISIILIICVIISCIAIPCFAETDIPELTAQSAVVICADTGQIIYGKNEHEKRSMASTTKIMTALLALEIAAADDVDITITDKMVPVEGSSMHLEVGNVLPLSSLAKGMLTVSGNDAANSAAIALSGSVELFADMMNEKAKQIGMKSTNFVTPSGLDHDNHYSTAYDLALLGSYAMENESFYNICSKRKVEVPFTEPYKTITLCNENRMLKRYDGCVGIKTGFTKTAGRCLVSCAEREKLRLVAVTLNAGDDWNDHEKLLDYGFSKMKAVVFEDNNLFKVPLVGSDENELICTTKVPIKAIVDRNEANKITQLVELPAFVYVPIKEGDIVGKIQYILNGKVIETNDLFAQKQCNYSNKEKNIIKKIFDFLKNFFKKNGD